MLRVFAVGALAAPSLAMVVSHQYEDMTAFNFPVDADLIRQRINPAVSLDLDSSGQAWVSVLTSTLPKTTIDGVPVPLIKPSEVQIRTYVTGPHPSSKEMVKGVWVFALLLHERILPSGPDIIGAKVLFDNTIHVAGGKINVARTSSAYSVGGSDLEVAPDIKATFSLSASISPDPLDVSADFFLKRDAWFGQNGDGQLAVSLLRDQKQDAVSTRANVTDFSSSVLSALSLGEDFGPDVFSRHSESCFFVGRFFATWDSSVLIDAADVQEGHLARSVLV